MRLFKCVDNKDFETYTELGFLIIDKIYRGEISQEHNGLLYLELEGFDNVLFRKERFVDVTRKLKLERILCSK
jgi:starvation-inducible outer membrane lipoprotein